jgi:uncharacterized protein YraI
MKSWHYAIAFAAAAWVLAAACGVAGETGGEKRGGETAKVEKEGTALSAEVGPISEYVVYVDKLKLRAGPSTSAAVITELGRRSYLVNKSEVVTAVEGRYWRQVEFNGKTGWVADRYVLPELFYEAFKKADELGRAGDGEGMIAAAIEGFKKVDYLEDITDYYYDYYNIVSPDGLKVILKGHWSSDDTFDWGGGYPGRGRVYSPFPVFFFVSGRGLVEYFRTYEEIRGKWSPDSRYYVYTESVIVEFGFGSPLKLLDTETWRREDIGFVATPEYGFEFADGYVVWFGEELIEDRPPYLEEESYAPVLWAYNMKPGDRVRILEADLSTMGTEVVHEGFGTKFYEVKMVPAGLCPAAVENTGLYRKFANRFAEAEDRTHWME